jgi:hypothetical protein
MLRDCNEPKNTQIYKYRQIYLENLRLGVIQIICDTLSVCGVNKVSQRHFSPFEILFVMLWEEKLFVTGQYNASKDTLYLYQ